MLQVIQTRSLQLLETLVNTLDSYDELKKRPRRFAQKQEGEQEEEHHSESEPEQQPERNQEH